MSPSIIFRLSCFAFVCGVIAYAFVYGGIPLFFLLLALLVASACAVVARKKRAIFFPALLCGIFFFGMMRAAMSGTVLESGDYADAKKFLPVSIQGIVHAEPLLTQSRQVLPLRVQNMDEIEGGRILRDVRVFSTLMPAYHYGDELYVRCMLIPVQNGPCVQADIRRISRGKGNVGFAFLLRGKELFLNAVRTHLSEPHASLLGALLVGERSGFPAWLTDAFIRSGILHIVAISGYNISIVMAGMYAALRAFSVSRKRSFWCIIIGIFFFVLMTGSSASVVRAAIMGGVALVAQYIGRKQYAGNAILCAAGVMIFWDPSIIFDIGFQLSFAATCGLIYISPILERACENISSAYGTKTIALQTISATLATAPLLIFSFQRFSVVALAVNMLVLPVIPLVMALGFFWAVFAFAGGMLTALIPIPIDTFIHIAGWPIWFLLSYIMISAQWFSQISWASVDVRLGSWNWVFMYAAYVSIVWFVWAQGYILKKKRTVIQCEQSIIRRLP
ncbi:ComEC/Rec2 family competence protein [Candidatus Uhrbacteria bacterium]|nr:ComEC/Rec2 family competence protein [Candidatus Uhrbacteria bacterium]